jgi:hypothetical protein
MCCEVKPKEKRRQLVENPIRDDEETTAQMPIFSANQIRTRQIKGHIIGKHLRQQNFGLQLTYCIQNK